MHCKFILRSFALSLALASSSSAEDNLTEWWADHGSYTIRNVSSMLVQEYAEVPLNRINLLNLPDQTFQNEFRPEIGIDYDNFSFSLSPRLTAKYENYTSGIFARGWEGDTDFFVNGWRAQYFPSVDLSVSYERENLQWGPSFLLSPSNPFDSKNGKQEPNTEVKAADYLKVVWTPNFDWTVSLLANVDKGEKGEFIISGFELDFEPVYALKVDYIFNRGSATLIASVKDGMEEEDARLGGYLSYNLSDAWIGYVEGSVSQDDTEALIGLSYTTDSAMTIAVEYYHNSSGAAEDPNNLLGLIYLASRADFREGFLRQNYLLLQAYQNDIVGSLDVILRHTQNLDDGSFSLLGHLEWDISNNALGFISTTINSNRDGELDSLREYRIQAGIELIF